MDSDNPLSRAKVQVARLERSWEDRFRFVLQGPNNLCSAQWAVWGHKGSVYLASRSIGGSMKVSLHPRGDYRFAEPREQRTMRIGDEPRRLYASWPRSEAPATGAKMILSLMFPVDTFKLQQPKGTASKPLLILRVEKLGVSVQFGFFVSREPQATLESKLLRIGRPMFCWQHGVDTTISMVSREVPFNFSMLPPPPQIPSTSFPADAVDRPLTALLWGDPQDGALGLIEVGGVTVTRSRSQSA
jgi:hypothetical protein